MSRSVRLFVGGKRAASSILADTAKQMLPSHKAPLYTCTMGGSSATGYPADNGFVVLKGSTVSAKITPSLECASKSYYNLRNRLLAEGVIADRVFQVTYTFSSPTAAAAVVAGRIISGRTAWIPVREKGC